MAIRGARGWAGAVYRAAVVRGRWVVVLAWIAVAAAVYTTLPNGHAVGGDAGFSNLLPAGSPALAVETRALAAFRVPVLSGTTVVVRRPGGLDLADRAWIDAQAVKVTRPSIRSGPTTVPNHVVAAVPVPLIARDTSVTYLFFSPGTSIWQSMTLARHYAADLRHRGGERFSTSVTGFVPAQVAQGEQLAAALPLFEGASLAVIVGIVALTFRSVLAPALVLLVGGGGYLVFYRVLAGSAGAFGLAVPQQLEPVLAALFIGVITDYCVLLFSTFRGEILAGRDRFDGVRGALTADAPVVAVAATTVAGGIIALLVSPFEFFRSLGPALALTVAAAAVVSLTLTPALMSLVGARLFSLRGGAHLRRRAARRAERRPDRERLPVRALRRLTDRRGLAAIAVVLAVAAMAVAAAPVLHARLSLSFTAGLPADDPVAEGAQVLAAAHIRGITAPVEVLVEGQGVTGERDALGRLQRSLAAQPGVVRVIGPGDNPLQDPLKAELGIVLAASGNAARYVVVLDSDPLGARAIRELRGLQRSLPRLVQDAGLAASADLTGQTRIASEVAGLTNESLRDTLAAALLIELVILVLYLRSVLAPLAILLSGLLSMGAALGLTVLLFQNVLGQSGLTFYAPFSTAVLLLALGSDYTVFTVGAIWRGARRWPLREAIVRTLPGTAKAVTAAGIILAGTFAAVGLVPLAAFQQIAFTMAAGLLIDTVLVRPVLTPAILSLLGRAALWPSRAGARHVAPDGGG
ncbi:MAG TPA: MMPL family transporter [Amnibacterium sp.]|nr:MMPL family transporter [Amnibacterium sp.]